MLHFTTYTHDTHTEWVTFVHGGGGSSSIWFRQLRDFRKHFNVLLVDLRGHGKSKRPIYEKLKQYTFDKIGDEVIEVLDHLQIKSTHFVGISLGTIIIREITERYPERTKSMIMGGAIMKLNLRGQILMRLGVLLKSVIPYLLLYRFFAFIIMPGRSTGNRATCSSRKPKNFTRRNSNDGSPSCRRLTRCWHFFGSKIPVYPLCTSWDPKIICFLPSIAKLVKDHRSSELFVISDCGHVVNVERPDVFNSKAIGFIQSLENKPLWQK